MPSFICHLYSKVFVCIALMGLFFSCSVLKKKPAEIPPAPLLNTYWRVTELNKVPVKTKAEKTPYVIMYADNTFKGFAGCNEMWGIFKWMNDKLKFSNTNRTKIACDDLNVESEFVEALENSDHYLIQGDKLYLIGNAEIVARLNAIKK